MWVSVALEGPARKELLRPLAEMSSCYVMELKRLWDASLPILHLECGGQDFTEGVEALNGLLEWADGHDIPVRLYDAEWPLDASDVPLPEPEDRRIVLNMLHGWLAGMSRDEDRTPLEIAERALCLIVLYVRSKGNEERARELIAEYEVADAFSPSERRYIGKRKPSSKENRHYTWSIEAAAVLLWAIGLYELPPLTEQVDVGRIVEIVKRKTAAQLASEAKEPMLAEEEYWPSTDLFDMHWSIRDARLNGRSDPDGFDPDVVVERRHAFEWLETRAPWDDVDLST